MERLFCYSVIIETLCFLLTLSWRRQISYRKQSIDLLRKSMDWFLYDIGLRHERVKIKKYNQIKIHKNRTMYIYSSCLSNRETPSTGLQLFLPMLDLLKLPRFHDFDEYLWSFMVEKKTFHIENISKNTRP